MKNNFINQLKREMNYTATENGAGAYKSTMNACLDAFGSLGAMKDSDESDILRVFNAAFAENQELAMRMLFYMRDIRGGQGMRRVFRVIIKDLAERNSELVYQNLSNILYYGRGDDYLCLLDTSMQRQVAGFLLEQIEHDLYYAYMPGGECSLLAKWLPSENASSAETKRYARMLIKLWGYAPKAYRHILSILRSHLDVTERKMSANKWDRINYAAVPAKAAMNYGEAFDRHDEVRYNDYLADVAIGKAKVNAKSLFPVDIVHNCMKNTSKQQQILYDAMWNALPNYFDGKNESGICVVDVSGSMSGIPMEVAISLGMYCADKCTGPFKDHFITFSSNPELVQITGSNIVEKVRNISRANWDSSTNLEAVFDLILQTAINNRCKQDELPNKLYIISDMQFNEARGDYGYSRDYWARIFRQPVNAYNRPFMKQMEQKYHDAGYEMPILIYWNVRESNCGMFQQTVEDKQCAMISGYSASLFKAVLEGTTYEEEVREDGSTTLKETVDPMVVMLTALNNERYDRVVTKI